MELKTLYQDNDLLVIDKPPRLPVAGIPVAGIGSLQLVSWLVGQYPELKRVGMAPRYGLVHRLDQDTSGVLLVAKNNPALKWLQKQFKERKVEKKYLALVAGKFKENQGRIETLLGRDPKNPKRQRAYLSISPAAKRAGLRKALTQYKVLQRFADYTLLELKPLTGRKHQLRAHMAFIGHPVAGDKVYGFKNQPCPPGLSRQFLHASYLKIAMPDARIREFKSGLPVDLAAILAKI